MKKKTNNANKLREAPPAKITSSSSQEVGPTSPIPNAERMPDFVGVPVYRLKTGTPLRQDIGTSTSTDQVRAENEDDEVDDEVAEEEEQEVNPSMETEEGHQTLPEDVTKGEKEGSDMVEESLPPERGHHRGRKASRYSPRGRRYASESSRSSSRSSSSSSSSSSTSSLSSSSSSTTHKRRRHHRHRRHGRKGHRHRKDDDGRHSRRHSDGDRQSKRRRHRSISPPRAAPSQVAAIQMTSTIRQVRLNKINTHLLADFKEFVNSSYHDSKARGVWDGHIDTKTIATLESMIVVALEDSQVSLHPKP